MSGWLFFFGVYFVYAVNKENFLMQKKSEIRPKVRLFFEGKQQCPAVMIFKRKLGRIYLTSPKEFSKNEEDSRILTILFFLFFLF